MKTFALVGIALIVAFAAFDARAQDKKMPPQPMPMPMDKPARPGMGMGMSGMGTEKQVGITVTSAILMTPADLKWGEGPPSLPRGAKMAVIEGDPKASDALFTLRLKVPANYRVMPHHHLTDEHITVVSGTVALGMGDKFDPAQLKDLPAGSFAVMPAQHHHFAMARTEAVIQIHARGPWMIVYVNPTDDPRNQAQK